MITLVPATRELVDAYHDGIPINYSMCGIVALEDGVPIGIGGIYNYNNRTYMFCEMKDCARKYRKYIIKAGREVLKLAEGKIVYAVAQDGIESAPRFLEHLGFEHVNGTLYVKR